MSTSASCGEALAAATGEFLPVPAEIADVLAAVDPRMHARVVEDYREVARAQGDGGAAARADFTRLYGDHRASAEPARDPEPPRPTSPPAEASATSFYDDHRASGEPVGELGTPLSTSPRIWLPSAQSTDNGQSVRRVVLVGHRAAGKSRVLPLIAARLGVPAVDLDREIERVHERPLRAWVAADVASFRRAEREVFASLPTRCVVAVGGGFWSNHANVLEGHLVVQVPVSFRTYRERLLADTSRPRLMADVSLEEEIRRVYRAREFVHRTLPHLTLGSFLASSGGRG